MSGTAASSAGLSRDFQAVQQNIAVAAAEVAAAAQIARAAFAALDRDDAFLVSLGEDRRRPGRH